MSMKKIIWATLLLLFSPVFIVHSMETIKVTAAESLYAKPVNGQLKGPAIDLIRMIFNDFGIDVETPVLPWKRAMLEAKVGKIDAILTLFYTKERSEYFEYTVPYDVVESSVFIKKGAGFKFKIWDDLIGLNGLYVRGTSEGKDFDNYARKHLKLEDKSSIQMIIEMLNANRADYGIEKKYGLMVQAKKLGLSETVEILPTPLKSNEVYFGFSKKSNFIKLIPKINQRIKELKDDGTVRNLIDEAIKNAAKN